MGSPHLWVLTVFFLYMGVWLMRQILGHADRVLRKTEAEDNSKVLSLFVALVLTLIGAIVFGLASAWRLTH